MRLPFRGFVVGERFRFILCTFYVFGFCALGQAQNTSLPATSGAAPANPPAKNDIYTLYEYEKTIAEQIKADPAKAAATQQAWVASLKQPRREIIAVAAIHASQWLETARDLKGAWDVLQSAFAKLVTKPESWWVMAAQIGLLGREKKYAEAEALTQKYWNETLNGGALDLVQAYFEMLEVQGKHEQGRAALKDALLRAPLLLEADHGKKPGWIYNAMIASLQRDSKEDEAISWAKLRFIQAPFNDAAIKGSTEALTRAMMAKDLSPVAVQAFLEAQNDPSKPNPLAAVPLPLKADEIANSLKNISGKLREETKARMRINLLLAGGSHREAMVIARQVLINNVGSAAGAEEVCRVFKAMDLSLKRGNEFIAYLKTGTGTNPVTEYFKSVEGAPATPQP